MKRAVLVNGVPASGKSTLARAVAARLSCPLLALDTIKEPLFAELGTGDRDHNRALGRASYAAMFAAIGDFPAPMTVVVDAWFGFQPLTVLDRHLATAGIGRAVELWCHAPGTVLADRYRARLGDRSPGHPGADYIPELVVLNERARPTGRAPSFDIDTTQPLPLDAVMAWIGRTLAGAPEARP